MFKKIKYLITFVMIVLLMSGNMGCTTFNNFMSKQYVTETGRVLSPEFGKVYQFNLLAKNLYDVTMSLTNEAYEKDYLKDEDIEQIIEGANVFVSLQILASDSIIAWYDAVENNDPEVLNKKEMALIVLTDVVKNSQELVDLIETVSNGKVKIPKTTILTMVALFEAVKEIK